MPSEAPPPVAGIAALRQPGAWLRFAAVGAVLALVVGAYAYVAGYLTPKKVKPADFADAFERVDGLHPGFRRNHAKGLCVSGYFDSSGGGVRLSKAAVFRTGRVPVVGRFSFGGGKPLVADSPTAVRGLGLQFTAPGDTPWRTAMINLPVFPVSTPLAFLERLLAGAPDPATGKPDPRAMAAFNERHPESVRALKVIQSQPPSSAFANSTFHSLNAFRFTAADGTDHFVRWELVPEDPVAPAATTGPSTRPDEANAIFDGLIDRVHAGPTRWRLVLIVAQPDDPTTDATLPWPPDRERVDAGVVTIDRVESEETSPVRDINFDPLVLPNGIAPSDDPLLSARSAVYARSFTRRESEPKAAPAITAAEVGRTH